MNYFTILCASSYDPTYKHINYTGGIHAGPGYTLNGYAGPGCTTPSGSPQYAIPYGPLDECYDLHMESEGYYTFGTNFTTGGIKVQCGRYGGLNQTSLHR